MPYIRIPHECGKDWFLTNCEIAIPIKSIVNMTAEEIGLCVQVLAELHHQIPEQFYYDNSYADLDDALEYISSYRQEIPHELRAIIRKEFRDNRAEFLTAIIERDGQFCARCQTTERLSIDHIMPVSRGGTNALDNLRLLCRPCNSKKSNKIQKG